MIFFLVGGFHFFLPASRELCSQSLSVPEVTICAVVSRLGHLRPFVAVHARDMRKIIRELSRSATVRGIQDLAEVHRISIIPSHCFQNPSRMA